MLAQQQLWLWVEKIIQLDLDDKELTSLQGSAEFYKEQLKNILGY